MYYMALCAVCDNKLTGWQDDHLLRSDWDHAERDDTHAASPIPYTVGLELGVDAETLRRMKPHR